MVHLSVIELINTEGTEHEEERIFGGDLDYYPSYKEGDTLSLEDSTREESRLRHTHYTIVHVHHFLRTTTRGVTFASLDIYVRKVY